MSKLEIKNVSKRFKHKENEFLLTIEGLKVSAGAIHALLGPSGCGKTTLLKILSGLEQQESGEILVDDLCVNSMGVEERQVGMVFQKPLLFPHMTVLENVALALYHRIGKEKARVTAIDMLEQVGLAEYGDRLPKRLSGGQAQRVALARALVIKPKILLLDEPLSALDQHLKADMIQLIQKLNREYQMTMVYVTHDVNEAVSISTEMTLLESGQIYETGKTKTLLDQPKRFNTARLMGYDNQILNHKMIMGNEKYLGFKSSDLRKVSGESHENDLFKFEGIVEEIQQTLYGELLICQSPYGRIRCLSNDSSEGVIERGSKMTLGIDLKNCVTFND